ncbi:MAG TPA: hypothetical protein VK638_39895 [Edaphobacter sp.]|nr:hypothetical protein [Edaphobacter sp.]
MIAHAGTADVHLHEFKINVPPGERDKLRSPQAGAACQHHHRTFPKFQFGQQRCNLGWREYVWFP